MNVQKRGALKMGRMKIERKCRWERRERRRHKLNGLLVTRRCPFTTPQAFYVISGTAPLWPHFGKDIVVKCTRIYGNTQLMYNFVSHTFKWCFTCHFATIKYRCLVMTNTPHSVVEAFSSFTSYSWQSIQPLSGSLELKLFSWWWRQSFDINVDNKKGSKGCFAFFRYLCC